VHVVTCERVAFRSRSSGAGWGGSRSPSTARRQGGGGGGSWVMQMRGEDDVSASLPSHRNPPPAFPRGRKRFAQPGVVARLVHVVLRPEGE
jgi:hypothetical protein